MKIIKIVSKLHGIHDILVDDEDYYFLNTNFKWYIAKDITKEYYYPVGSVIGNSRKKYRLSRLVMNVFDPNILVDHIDRNPLNNQKNNLRFATQAQNQCNRPRKSARSGFKGVRKSHGGYGYQIALRCNYKTICGGTWPSIIEAAYNYNAFAKKHHKEFAYQNPVTATKYKDGTMYVHEKKTGNITERIHHFIPSI